MREGGLHPQMGFYPGHSSGKPIQAAQPGGEASSPSTRGRKWWHVGVGFFLWTEGLQVWYFCNQEEKLYPRPRGWVGHPASRGGVQEPLPIIPELNDKKHL